MYSSYLFFLTGGFFEYRCLVDVAVVVVVVAIVAIVVEVAVVDVLSDPDSSSGLILHQELTNYFP